MTVDVWDNRMLDVIDADASLTKVADGFKFLEGPIWHPKAKHLTFSDIPGDTLYRLDSADKVTIFRAPSNIGNGNT